MRDPWPAWKSTTWPRPICGFVRQAFLSITRTTSGFKYMATSAVCETFTPRRQRKQHRRRLAVDEDEEPGPLDQAAISAAANGTMPLIALFAEKVLPRRRKTKGQRKVRQGQVRRKRKTEVSAQREVWQRTWQRLEFEGIISGRSSFVAAEVLRR